MRVSKETLSSEAIQGIPLISRLVLLTWQKIAPISIIFQITPFINPTLIISIAILFIVLGGWGGHNQTQLWKILAYSSITHVGWIIAIIIFYPTLTMFNLAIYIILIIKIFLLFYYNKKSTTLSLSSTWNKFPLLILTTYQGVETHKIIKVRTKV